MLALTLALSLLGTPRQDLEIPKNDGWVTDLAGMLSRQQEASLEALMESYRTGTGQTGTGQEVALLTLPNLGGRPIEEVALAVARDWKIGDRETNSGALLLVAQQERALRIEVGRGLEGALSDSIAGRIIRDVIAPEFKGQRFFAGIRGGIEAIHAALGGDYGPIERGSSRRGRSGAFLTIFLLMAFLALLSRKNRAAGRFRGTGGGVLPWILASQLGHHGSSGGVGGFSGGSFGGFGGGGGFSGGGASGGW